MSLMVYSLLLHNPMMGHDVRLTGCKYGKKFAFFNIAIKTVN